MQCELCGGLVTWRGRLSALTHTECERCGGQNCQVSDGVDERRPELIVGQSEARGGWCLFEQTDYAEYVLLRGPFPSQDEANASLARLMARSKTSNGRIDRRA